MKRSYLYVLTASIVAIVAAYAWSYNTPHYEPIMITRDPGAESASIFDIPVKRINGIPDPLFSDTSEKQLLIVTPNNMSALGSNLYPKKFEFCTENENSIHPLGQDDNPAIVKIGDPRPAVIIFCVSNLGQTRELYVLRVREADVSDVIDPTQYDNNIQGLNITLNTRTVDIPPFEPLANAARTFEHAPFLIERIHLNITANSDARMGLHFFSIDAMEPQSEESGGYARRGTPIWVEVRR